MKKTTLLLGASLLALSASAQFRTQMVPMATVPVDQPVLKTGNSLPNVYSNPAEASKTSAVAPRWYNHPEALGRGNGVDPYQEDLRSFNIIWPDSTVRFTDANGAPSASGINWLSYGEIFSPSNTLYNGINSANRGQLRITSNDAYTVDSIKLRGLYSRTNATAKPDTMLVVVVAETAAAKFTHFRYNSADILTNHGIDSFAALLYQNSTYQKLSTQVGYRVGTTAPFLTADTFKIVMNQATFLDSMADGSHVLRLALPKKSVVAGGRIAMTATFKPGEAYTPGSAITDHNFWAFMSHEIPTAGGFVFYIPGDVNMSYNLFKDSSGAMVAPTLSIYQPSITWTAPFTSEVHNVSWFASCATCVAVGVDDVNTSMNIGEAYPNPARTSVTIPVTVKSAANVSVSLSNAVGQVVSRQTLNAAAGQTRNAVFNTEALANGIYIYTVESNGERFTNRIVVAH